MTSKQQRKLVAILSADVVGYSRLMAADEASTVATLEALRGVIEALAPQRGGRVVNFVGDNFLAEFATASDATSCAIDIQREVQTRGAAASADRRMQFRWGFTSARAARRRPNYPLFRDDPHFASLRDFAAMQSLLAELEREWNGYREEFGRG